MVDLKIGVLSGEARIIAERVGGVVDGVAIWTLLIGNGKEVELVVEVISGEVD